MKLKETKDQQIARLKHEKQVLIKFILRHRPDMEDWIKLNFTNRNKHVSIINKQQGGRTHD